MMKMLILSLMLVTAGFAAEKQEYSVHDYYSAAQTAQNDGDWKTASQYAQIVATHFDKSAFASDALFLLGRAHYELGEYELANDAFTEYLKKQTSPEEFEQAIRYKFEIANRFEEGARLHLLGWQALPKWASAKELAIDIYDEVIATLPRHELASESLYRKATLLFSLGDFRESIDAYQTLARRFPKHHRAPDSYIGVANVYLKQCEVEYKNPDYLDLAEINLNKFANAFPNDERVTEAQAMFLNMKEKYAADLLESAKFYERTKKPQAAALYYNNIAHRYPSTKAAQQSEKRLEKIGHLLPGKE